MRKQTICICENNGADQLRGNREADQRLCFRYRDIVQFLYFLNPKFPVPSHLLCLYSPVCVGPARKPHCWFSHEAAHMFSLHPLAASFHIIVRLRGAGAFSRDFTTNMTPQCRAFSRTLKTEKFKASLLLRCSPAQERP